MSGPERLAVDTSSWISLRWERGTRYYRSHLEQDLWGHWTLTRVNGRTGTRRGRYMTSWVASLEDGLMTLAGIAKRRRLRGYQLVNGLRTERRTTTWNPSPKPCDC